MSVTWKKIPTQPKWQYSIAELDVLLEITLEAASYDHPRRYVLRMWHNQTELVDFYKYIGSSNNNLRKNYFVKAYPTVKSVQSRILNRIEQLHQHIWFHTVGRKQIDGLIAHVGKYVNCYINRNKFISYYADGAIPTLEAKLAKLDDLTQQIHTATQSHRKDQAIWDSMKDQYTTPVLEVQVGTRTETRMTRSGYRPGYWTISGSDYHSDEVYVEPYWEHPDRYETYQVPVFKQVENHQYIKPPETPAALIEHEAEFTKLVAELDGEARRNYMATFG